ncbi:MAG TPA: mannosyltransferase family protein [Acidimicrobiales bacterium]|nr:mannosyltransferase family protein [Acidimicrobiales bacterium]
MSLRPRGGTVAGPLLEGGVPWLVARVLVITSVVLARYLVTHLHPGDQAAAVRAHEGLLGWDAGFYRDIAAHGYGSLPRAALRFFPLLPLMARGVHDVTRLSYDASLIGVANACALAASVLLVTLTREELGDGQAGRRAAWLLSLAPAGFIFVMGYAEPLFVLLSVTVFLGMRRQRWWLVALAGFLAGTSRPVGVLLVVPVAVEALGLLRRGRLGAGPVVAAVAPAAGAAAYLAWAGATFGDYLRPLRLQTSANLHGHLANPFTTVWDALRGAGHGHVGTALHVPWLVLFVLLTVVALRRLPLSYGLFALAVLVVAAGASNLDSLERYCASAVPLVMAAADVTAPPLLDRTVTAALGAAVTTYGLLAFLNAYVP